MINKFSSLCNRMESTFIILSLSLNIIILSCVCVALILFGKSRIVIDAWGNSSPSRGILSSIYLSILIISSILLFLHIQNPMSVSIKYMIFSLLLVQVIYKLTTPFTVNIKNPIVVSNLFVATFHIITLFLIRRERTMTIKMF